jgi:hypothetical protein
MYTSYSKVIIDLKGKRSVDLRRGTPCECGAFSLAGAVRYFIDENPVAKVALTNSGVAGESNASLTRALYKFLKAQDFYPALMVGYGFRKRLTSPSPQILEDMKKHGESCVVKELSHGVVKIHGLVVDLTHRRLGSSYSHLHNFPFKEFMAFWDEVKDMSHIADMTSEDAQALVKQNRAVVQTQMLNGEKLTKDDKHPDGNDHMHYVHVHH